MNLIKNKIFLVFAFFLLQFLSTSAFSAQVPDNLESVHCQSALDAIESNLEEREEDVNREFSTGGATGILKCAATKIGTTRLDTVFLSILGDSGQVPYAMTRALITDENYNDIKDSIEARTGNYYKNENLSNLLVSFNYIVNQVLIVLASLFFIFYLINTSHDGSLFGQNYNAFWKIMRFVFVIVLMAPVEVLNNFSIMQGIVFVIIAIAIYAATFIWYSLLFSEALFAIDYEGVKNSERAQVYSSVIDAVDKNIMLHICDIQNRKETILSRYPNSDMTSNNIETNQFNQCLETTTSTFSDRMKGQENESKKFKPLELKITEECASDPYLNVSRNLSCGQLNFSTGSNSTEAEQINFISDDYFQSEMGDAYQERVRDVAENVIALNCLQKAEGYVDSKADYMPKCAVYKDGFSYDPEGKLLSYPEAPVNYTSNGVKNKIQDLRTDLFDDLSNLANEEMMLTGNADLAMRLGNLIDAGFLGSVGYMSENGKKYASAKDSYQSVFSSYKISFSNGFVEEIEEEDTARSASGSALSLLNMKDALNTIGGRKEAESDLISEMFESMFIGLQTVREFNNTSVNKDERDSDLDCLDDFNLCSVVSLNPINDIIKKGVDIADSIQGWALLFVAVEYGSNYLLSKINDQDYSTSNMGMRYSLVLINAISGLIAGVLMAQLLIGYLMIYGIPLIIFIFFIGVLISWVISAFEAIVIINFWLILHLLPSREEGFAGQAKRGYNLLLSLLVKPSFIVIGLFVAFVMASIMVSFLNVSFGVVMDTFSIFNSPDSYLGLVYNVIIDMLYFIALFYICFRACKSIYKIPRSLISWIGFDDDTASGAFSNIFEEYKGMLMVNMKKYLIIV